MNHQSQIQSDDKQRVRRNAGSAAIAAVCMLYYGFERMGEPTGTDLFSKANLVFFYTLRIGGIVMALLAIWCWIGHTTALIVDAVVSIGLGALFALTGVGMLIDGGGMFQSVLNVLFGWMFYAAGVNNWSTYREITSNPAGHDLFPPHSQETMKPANIVEQIRSSHHEPLQEPVAIDESALRAEPTTEEEVELEQHTIDVPPPVDTEPAGGFLASFANKKDPPQE